jgi:hypothetical protein
MPGPLLIPFVSASLTWVLREVVVKFVVFSAIFAVVAFFIPYVIKHVSPFANAGFIGNGLSLIDSGVWFFLRFFRIDYGLQIIVSAYVSRFLIRRIPFVG